MKNKYGLMLALAMGGALAGEVNHTHREKSESKPLPAQSYDRKKHNNKRAKRRKKGGKP